MPLPDNFSLLAVNPAIRQEDGFLFLQSGSGGYIDLFLQSATGSPVNILKIASGVPIAKKLYVNENGNDSTAKKYTIDFPYKTIGSALNSAGANDTIEVFPGAYDVSGNLFKENVSLYFHKGASISFLSSGKIISTGADTGIFNILGHGYFTSSAAADAFKISGGQVIFEFDGINLDTANLEIIGVTNAQSNVVFRTLGEGNTYGGQLACNNINLRNANVKFEEIKFLSNRIFSTGATNKPTFRDCVFSQVDSNLNNPVYQFSGKYEFDNCQFTDSYPKFISQTQCKISNTEFKGGVIISGNNYFDRCTFDAYNATYFPNNSLISCLGGHNVFSFCFAKDFSNTSNVSYTFRNSGSASGATNFNINGMFSSFVPNFSGITTQYGIFSYDISMK
jgi:hypothetical protein